MDGFARRRLRTAVGTQQLEIGEGRTLAVNQPGAWLLSRAWVAWRTVLAQGREKNGRRVLQGARRAHLREQLFQVAFREQREFWVPETQLADLQEARRRTWRRWLRLGGWGAFHACSARLDRARRSRALAAQRDGMRRWAVRANGCCWHILTDTEVEERFELPHEGLRRLLATKQILSDVEWKRPLGND